ncbi:uncharacterized protein BJ212DRAFT_1303752 [Suillus subaureus]|uniref:Uncharacterized protein n=1 Tax=Suillus subaureus TaxID=48587 RepID=A0A9P7DY70_9AGAM|nr:uncharacterized protein BJ212DRAFT_1303752 [Suillus subaureus]KAG1806090.1 hypothetical protein BJ212DRAFT_1303752 [Suillus subaureus]
MSSHRSPPVVEVPALDDKKALYTARRPERASDKAKRIKNPKWWARVYLVPLSRRIGPVLTHGREVIFVATHHETASEKARRIKNPKLWVRVVLFLCWIPAVTNTLNTHDRKYYYSRTGLASISCLKTLILFVE